MHEDELLAVYRKNYPQFRNVDHREQMRDFRRSLRKIGWEAPGAEQGGYAVITGVANAQIGAVKNSPPPYAPGEILVLEGQNGGEVLASGRNRCPAKWGAAVHYYYTEDYSKALTAANRVHDTVEALRKTREAE